MNRGYLAKCKGGQVWVIVDEDYQQVSATVVYVEPGSDLRLGQNLLEP